MKLERLKTVYDPSAAHSAQWQKLELILRRLLQHRNISERRERVVYASLRPAEAFMRACMYFPVCCSNSVRTGSTGPPNSAGLKRCWPLEFFCIQSLLPGSFRLWYQEPGRLSQLRTADRKQYFIVKSFEIWTVNSLKFTS